VGFTGRTITRVLRYALPHQSDPRFKESDTFAQPFLLVARTGCHICDCFELIPPDEVQPTNRFVRACTDQGGDLVA